MQDSYSIDFSNHKDLTQEEIGRLNQIQLDYRPIERTDYLFEYKISGKITSDEFEILTGILDI